MCGLCPRRPCPADVQVLQPYGQYSSGIIRQLFVSAGLLFTDFEAYTVSGLLQYTFTPVQLPVGNVVVENATWNSSSSVTWLVYNQMHGYRWVHCCAGGGGAGLVC